ncbi:transglycosylase family protein [Streptomyces sp. NPDC093544]|uniref:LysM peptidoglycan-binding domain-containing protein n=1 Tax=Streptomyces sp. NPDC093544 TaxID=3155200 RepID=UPI0034401FB2
MTGSAIAIPLLGATSASAADTTTWDRVAECETGSSWSDNIGDGYYGGLHVTQWDWENYGGLEYAPSADQASRSQQIAVAEKILDGRGLVAWPTCGPLSGLSKDSASVEVDTGVSDDPSSDASATPGASGSADPSESSSPSPSASPSSGATESTGDSTKSDSSDEGASADASTDASTDSSAANGDESDKSTQGDDSSSASEDEASGAGRHRGDIAAEGATDGGTDDAASGRHASRGSDEARDVVDGSYVVRVGDSLSLIADALGLDGGWTQLYAENKETVGADADLILPGQSLAVGAEPGEK